MALVLREYTFKYLQQRHHIYKILSNGSEKNLEIQVELSVKMLTPGELGLKT